MSAVYGYTIVNDVSSRTLQTRHNQFFLGKSLDTYCPVGPYITTADEVPDPTALRIVTKVNGEIRRERDGRRSDLRRPEPDRDLGRHDDPAAGRP